MDFKIWLSENYTKPSYRVTPYRANPYALPNVSNYRQKDGSVVDKATSAVAHGIGQNFMKALYPSGIGMPQHVSPLGFGAHDHPDRMEYAVSMPLQGMSKKDAEDHLLHHVASTEEQNLLKKGAEPRFGRVQYSNIVGDTITVHLVFPKGDAKHVLGKHI